MIDKNHTFNELSFAREILGNGDKT